VVVNPLSVLYEVADTVVDAGSWLLVVETASLVLLLGLLVLDVVVSWVVDLETSVIVVVASEVVVVVASVVVVVGTSLVVVVAAGVVVVKVLVALHFGLPLSKHPIS